MLEVAARGGRGRLAHWSPWEGASVRTPALVVPDVGFHPVPPWAEVVVTAKPQGRAVEMVSGGTWFHPTGAEGPLVVPPQQPGPTGQVQVLDVGEDLAVWHDAGGWASDPSRAVAALLEARAKATPGRLLWAPALGTPADYAVWCYAGVDLFDATPLLLAAARGQALTTDGSLELEEAERVFGGTWDVERLAAHNLEAARQELALVAHHLGKGTLRALAERRSYSRPQSVETLRRLDHEHDYLEAAAPVHRDGPLACMTAESLFAPEVERFRRRVRDRYTPPASPDILVLLPCSAKKPYRTSRSHRFLQRALDDSGLRHRTHEAMVTSPLGIVPRELEELYPARAYDVPVTGRWTRDEEELIRGQLAALLAKHDYAHVVAHLEPATVAMLEGVLPEGTLTPAQGRPSSQADCARLTQALRGLGGQGGDAAVSGRRRKMHDVHALATYQFGPAAAADLTAGAHAHGRVPYVKFDGADGHQLGMTTEGRGLLSLTLDGALRIAAHDGCRVRIQDFEVKGTGSLFAVGVVDADEAVRPGDEVVVVHGDEVRGVGVAQMAAEEMRHARRGVAVQLRHAAPRGKIRLAEVAP